GGGRSAGGGAGGGVAGDGGGAEWGRPIALEGAARREAGVLEQVAVGCHQRAELVAGDGRVAERECAAVAADAEPGVEHFELAVGVARRDRVAVDVAVGDRERPAVSHVDAAGVCAELQEVAPPDQEPEAATDTA